MEILQRFIQFSNNILSFKIFENVTILELFIYIIFINAIISIIKIATKGKNN